MAGCDKPGPVQDISDVWDLFHPISMQKQLDLLACQWCRCSVCPVTLDHPGPDKHWPPPSRCLGLALSLAMLLGQHEPAIRERPNA